MRDETHDRHPSGGCRPPNSPSTANALSPAGQENPTQGVRQDFLRQVLDINPNLIFAKDREGRFTLVNQAVADIYGTTVEGLIGKTDADFNPNADEVAFFRRMDLEVMNSLQERIIPEEMITDAKGVTHWLQTVKRPIIGSDGRANQVLGVATDITARRQLEEQLRQPQKMEALGLLAGGIAHDFNNLLAVVFGNAELMLDRLKKEPTPSPKLLTSLELIIAAAKRAESLTRQLLSFSRRQAMNPVILDFNEVLADLEHLLNRVIGEDVSLRVNRAATPLYVQADSGQLEQVLMNLAINAREAMPRGGTLTITTSATDLDESHVGRHPEARTGRHVLLSVSDTGMGMTPETRGRIFEPFFTTKPVGQGTGLGLSTVYGIVKQAGGHVTVQSELGIGTTFAVYFPEVRPAPAKPNTVSAPELAGGGRETVLICEDEEPVLRLACEALESEGYLVLSATTGRSALELAARHAGPIHLLLTDVVMPEVNGRQLADAIRAARPKTQVLFMTGYSSDVLTDRGGEDKLHLLAKPYSRKSLLARVREVIDGCR
jgi:PAS domain S-box-containing protein